MNKLSASKIVHSKSWKLSNVSLFIAISIDTSEMRFLEEEKHFHLHKVIQNRELLFVCLSVCLVNE